MKLKLNMYRSSLAALFVCWAGSYGLAQVVFTADDLERAMKAVERNLALANTALASKDFEAAKVRLIRTREQLSPTVSFWKNANEPDAVAMVKAATARLDDFDAALSANPVDPKVAAAAASALDAACQACHAVYREQDAGTKAFRLKPRGGKGESESGRAAPQQGAERAALLKALPRAADLPAGYRSVGKLAGLGDFYAAGGEAVFRLDDGGAHHGSGNTAEWAAMLAKGLKGREAQAVLYRVEDGAVTAAGYLIRQADLVAGKSFRGVTFGAPRFPAAQHLTIDLIKGATADANQYLWLWHFLPQQGRAGTMPPTAAALPSVTTLPSRFAVIGADVHPNAFYPRMGRHRRDLSTAGHRTPASAGDAAVLYGEAAGKLVFVEYTFSHKDFAGGVSWPAMPLNGVPVPPIDNLHIMHYAATSSAPEYFTVHMYFVPEEIYLHWDTEPPSLQ